MKKYQLTEDMAQYLKYRMTKILAGPVKEMVQKGEKVELNHAIGILNDLRKTFDTVNHAYCE